MTLWLVCCSLLVAAARTVPLLPCSAGATFSMESGGSPVDPETGLPLGASTKLQISNMENGMTACFTLTTLSTGEVKQYAVAVSSLEGSVGMQDQYEFGLPNVTATCTCSCTDSKGILDNCQVSGTGFCDEYFPQLGDRCVEVAPELDNDEKAGCTSSLISNPALCCTIGMKQQEITTRFKAFQVQSSPQYDVKLTLYDGYRRDSPGHEYTIHLGEKALVSEEGLIFEEVSTSLVGQSANPLESSKWYIGIKDPYEESVYETRLEINGQAERAVHKLGWVRYVDGIYQLNTPVVTDPNIEAAFNPNVENCGDSTLTSTFTSPKLSDLETSLTSLRSKHASTLESMNWSSTGSTNHGVVEWVYRRSPTMKTNVELKISGAIEDYELDSVYIPSHLGDDLKAQIYVTTHGDRYIQINTSETTGTIHGTYQDLNDEDSLFVFTRDFVEEQDVYVIRDTSLQCTDNANRQLCLETSGGDDEPICLTHLKCIEEEITDIEIDIEIDTEGVKSDDPFNLKTWAKFANPMEWLKNGIGSWQEAMMMGLELIGLLSGVFLVIKILRVFGVLGKCCRVMWCCFLCPKTEKKVRKRANTYYSDTKRRMTQRARSTRDRLATGVSNAKASIRRKRTLRRSEKDKVDDILASETFATRARANTAQMMDYVRKQLRAGNADDDQKKILNERGSSVDLSENVRYGDLEMGRNAAEKETDRAKVEDVKEDPYSTDPVKMRAKGDDSDKAKEDEGGREEGEGKVELGKTVSFNKPGRNSVAITEYGQ